MQTLLLLSHGKVLFHNLPEILGRSLTGAKVIHVTTAANGALTDMSPYWQTVHNAFDSYGCLVEDLDIKGREYQELKTILATADIVFVNGGNTFYLLEAVRESGFDRVVKELLPLGLIYMGASAGAYIACPTIEAATWKSNKNRVGLTDLSAMKLVPFLLSVHYIPEFRELLEEKIKCTDYPIRVLTDDQAILVKDGQEEFIGSGEVKL